MTTPPAPTTCCPTAGAGRAYSPLGVESFGRWMQVNRVTREGLARILPAVAAVAEAEGLTAHRRAVEIRFEDAGLMSLETTEALVATSNVYTWEPPNRVIAARYGLDPADILRFDPTPAPALLVVPARGARGSLRSAAHEYPDSTYAELAEAAAAYVGARARRDPRRLRRGRGARHHRQDLPGRGPALDRAGAHLLDVRGAHGPA